MPISLSIERATTRVRMVDGLFELADKVGVLGLGLERGGVCLGIAFLGELKGRDRSAAEVADRPYDPHSLRGFGTWAAGFASGARCARLLGVQTQGFSHIVGGPQLESVQWSAAHGCLTLITSVPVRFPYSTTLNAPDESNLVERSASAGKSVFK